MVNDTPRETLSRSLLCELADIFDRDAIEMFASHPLHDDAIKEGERLCAVADAIRARVR